MFQPTPATLYIVEIPNRVAVPQAQGVVLERLLAVTSNGIELKLDGSSEAAARWHFYVGIV